MQWELRKLWVPVGMTEDRSSVWADQTVTIIPNWTDDAFKKAWSEAETLSAAGWELVSVVPEHKSLAYTWAPDASQDVEGRAGQAYAYAVQVLAGYFFVFKRQRAG
jgi:hypothetical protein